MHTRLNPIERPISLEYILKTDVASVSLLTDTATLTPSQGKAWQSIYITLTKMKLEQISGKDAAGTRYDVKFTGQLPGDADLANSEFSSILGRQAYFRIKFRSGRYKLFGNPDRLPLCEISYESQVTTQRTLTITQSVLQPLPWIS